MKNKRTGFTKGQNGLVVGLGIIIIILASVLVIVPPKDRSSSQVKPQTIPDSK